MVSNVSPSSSFEGAVRHPHLTNCAWMSGPSQGAVARPSSPAVLQDTHQSFPALETGTRMRRREHLCVGAGIKRHVVLTLQEAASVSHQGTLPRHAQHSPALGLANVRSWVEEVGSNLRWPSKPVKAGF